MFKLNARGLGRGHSSAWKGDPKKGFLNRKKRDPFARCSGSDLWSVGRVTQGPGREGGASKKGMSVAERRTVPSAFSQ